VSAAKNADAEEALQRGLLPEGSRREYMRFASRPLSPKFWRDRGYSAKAHSLLAPLCDSFRRVSLRDLEDANDVLHHLNKIASPTVALA
jgi:hypothetical protein